MNLVGLHLHKVSLAPCANGPPNLVGNFREKKKKTFDENSSDIAGAPIQGGSCHWEPK